MSFLNKIFGEKGNSLDDFSVFGVDIHSHLIPGIDDGAKTLDDSVALAKSLKAIGFKKLITTPHVNFDYYNNSIETITKGLELVREALDIEGVDIEINAAAEYYLDHYLIERIRNHELLTLAHNYVLFELSYLNPPVNLNEVIFEFQTNDYSPVLAHPERYTYWFNQFDRYVELKERGVFFQLNVNSLTGEYSPVARKIAERLIEEGMIDFIGTDTHAAHHITLLSKVIRNKHLYKLQELGTTLNHTLA